MCIFVVTTKHSEFPLVLLDNRDEVFDRPTAAAHWWKENNNIYAPQDLERPERGTWIGVSRNGRICVLVNFFEANPSKSAISRGALPKQFLESELSPREWVQYIENKHKEELRNCGGFTLLVATVAPLESIPNGEHSDNKKSHTQVAFLSNRHTLIPETPSETTLALSNGAVDDPSWTKTERAVVLFERLMQLDDPMEITTEGIRILSTANNELPKDRLDLRKHIFIPRIAYSAKGEYGTRTQTVIVVDRRGQLYYTELDVKTGSANTEVFHICK